jgi:hypothetical protein
VTAITRRVILSDADANGELTATGVEFEYGGKVYEVTANKEVVLSAGYAFNDISGMILCLPI